MDWLKITILAVSLILTGLSTYYLQKGTFSPIRKDLNRNYSSDLPKMYKYVGIMSICFVLAFLFMSLFVQDRLTAAIFLFNIVLFGGLGLPCLLAYRNYSLTFNDKEIRVSNWRGEDFHMSWQEVQRTKVNVFSGYIYIIGRGKRIKINPHTKGLNIFLNELEQRKVTSSSVKEK